MSDSRIAVYTKVLRELSRNRFADPVPIEGSDGVAQLGEAVVKLGERIQRSWQQSDKLLSIVEKANSGLVLDEVLNHVFESIRPTIPYNRIGLALLENEREKVVSRWARSDSKHLKIDAGYSAPLQGSSLELVLETGQPRILNDLEAYLRDHPQSKSTELIVEEGMRSSLTCPLVAGGNPIGFLFFSSLKPNTYHREHQDFFVQLAGQLSMIVEKTRLYEEVLNLNNVLRRSRDRFQTRASRDGLTGVWNREAILRLLRREISLCKQTSCSLMVGLVDIDNFKALNDTHGHLIGDTLLVEAIRRISSCTRDSDSVGRYGGDEFLVVYSPCDANAAEMVLERLVRTVCMPEIDVNGTSVQMTISVGAAVAKSSEPVESRDLLEAADRALYSAKATGGNAWSISKE